MSKKMLGGNTDELPDLFINLLRVFGVLVLVALVIWFLIWAFNKMAKDGAKDREQGVR
jgi:hypothetical protein